MSRRLPALALLLGLVPLALHAEVPAKSLDSARKLANRLLGEIRGEVARALENGGPLRAMVVCKYSAPEISAALARANGMRITRVSLRPRNRSIGEPDAWEQEILLDFEKRVSKGEKAADLEHSAIVQEPAGRYFRYMKAIPMGPTCTACHGSGISDAIKSALAAEYPYDRAVDFAVGDVRGAVSVKQPLPN